MMGCMGLSPAQMSLFTRFDWEAVTGITAIVGLGATALWLALRRRPTAEELERRRRDFLVQSGRLVDGMLLDVHEVDGDDGRTLTFVLFNYRIGGVDYECSQDITNMAETVDAGSIRLGLPCSVRYQPGNPQNSIVVAERWSGLRVGLPVFQDNNDPEPRNTGPMHPKRN